MLSFTNMWTNDKTLSFIGDFQMSECLWNTLNNDYRNRVKKNNALEYLSQKYQIDLIEVEKKISNLRSQFRRERKKLLLSKKSGSSTKRTLWFAYEALSFLSQQVEPRENCCTVYNEQSSTNDNIEVQEDSALEESPANDTQSSFEETYEEETQEDRITFRQPKTIAERKRVFCDNNQKDTMTKCLKTLTEVISKRDDFSVYGEYIAARLRKSGRSHKEVVIAQHHIEQICFNLTMGLYSEESARYGVPPLKQSTTPMSSPANSEDTAYVNQR